MENEYMTKADKYELKLEIQSVRSELKTEIQDLRTEMHILHASTLKWMIGMFISLFLSLGGMILFKK